MFFGIAAALFLTFPSDAQLRRGSLVVVLVSKKADFVVVGAESRSVDLNLHFVSDSSCKILSLGGNTLFYESGASKGGKSWSSTGTARNVYKSSLNRDAFSLSAEWGKRALRWFNSLPEEELRALTQRSHGILVSTGFINFDPSGNLSVYSTEIVYNALHHRLDVQSASQVAGETAEFGVATDLVDEFFRGKTDRAIKALGPDGKLLFLAGVDQKTAVRVIQKAIKFAMDNATGDDKSALGGDIDIAVIHKDHTIEWPSRKDSCSKEDLIATPPPKH